MTDARSLLERHRPRLVYDSQEAYFADAAAIWTDSRDQRPQARGRDGARQAAEARAGVSRPARLRRRDEGAGQRHDRRDHARLRRHAAALHRQARYGDRVYGHARRDTQGRLWLQYWLFYYYNDFQLLGPLLRGGKHEGDWELVQLRLERRRAARAGRLQPAHARREQGLDGRQQGRSTTPLVYVARGSHANYFGPGSHWTGVLVRPRRRQGPADHAHARRRRRTRPRGCCGRAGGGTRRRRARRWTPAARTARGAARTGSTRRR